MITPVILPQLGDTMNEATLVAWLKREGEHVEKGEPLFEVLTDKANMQVEAMVTGFVRRIVHRENEVVPVGEVIGYITTTPDESLTIAKTNAPLVLTQAIGPALPTTAVALEQTTFKRRVSPRARRLAEEKGVDLSKVTASRPSGRVVEADVLKFLEQPHPPVVPSVLPVGPRVVPLAGIRKIIAERMSESTRSVARVTLTTEADAMRLVEVRSAFNARRRDAQISFTALFVKIAAAALQQHPHLNSTLVGDEIRVYAAAHIGVAVDTERGLLVPVIQEAQRKTLFEIAHALRDLSERARVGKLTPDELRGGTFTITNLGTYEIDAFTPIVNPGETAILGIGRIAEKPATYQGQLALRQMVALSLSFDHRVVDGAPAAQFLQTIKSFVEEPGLLIA